MKTCVKCLLPETHETIEFDANGVCNICANIHTKLHVVDWAARRRELDEIVAKAKARKDTYDCILPYSGGKDSVFQLLFAVRDLGLKPLVVQADHGFFRPGLRENNERAFKILGVDVVSFRVSWHVVRRVMLEGLIRKGDTCWACHGLIAAYPMQAALQYKIPLLLFGESTAEYTAYANFLDEDDATDTAVRDEWDFKRFAQTGSLGITAEDMIGMISDDSGFTERDLAPFKFPEERELKKLGVRAICLGNFIKWDTLAQTNRIKSELGWKGVIVEGVAPNWDYDKSECFQQGVRDLLKYYKRGYGRTNHLANIDIRHGRMTREEGAALEKEYDGKRPHSLDAFLEYLGITEDEFYQIADKTVVPPHVPTRGNSVGPPLPDFDKLDRTPVPWVNHPLRPRQ